MSDTDIPTPRVKTFVIGLVKSAIGCVVLIFDEDMDICDTEFDHFDSFEEADQYCRDEGDWLAGNAGVEAEHYRFPAPEGHSSEFSILDPLSAMAEAAAPWLIVAGLGIMAISFFPAGERLATRRSTSQDTSSPALLSYE